MKIMSITESDLVADTLECVVVIHVFGLFASLSGLADTIIQGDYVRADSCAAQGPASSPRLPTRAPYIVTPPLNVIVRTIAPIEDICDLGGVRERLFNQGGSNEDDARHQD
jgi:hypothetical protein